MNPGVYEMTNPDYHAETDWLGSTQLKRFLPEFYRPSTGTSDALEFGTAVHTAILGVGETVARVDADSWRTKAAQEQREAARQAGQVPLLVADIAKVERMRQTVMDHPEASGLFKDGRPEVSVFAEVDGVPCKARFDWLADGYAVDVKTTSAQPGEHALTRAVLDFGYDFSADHYLRVAAAAGLDVETFLLVFVGKDDPHYVTVVELDESFYDRAAVLRELALERVQHADMVGTYPGFEGRLNLSAPRWARL